MLEFLPFWHHCGAYQLTAGYRLSDADLGELAGILALGETCVCRTPAKPARRVFELDVIFSMRRSVSAGCHLSFAFPVSDVICRDRREDAFRLPMFAFG